MSFEKKRNANLLVLSTPAVFAGTFTDSAGVTAAMANNAIPGATDFGYDHDLGVTLQGKGQFGLNKPVGLTDEYGGIKGNFDIQGTDGEAAVLAAVSRIARSAFVNANYNKLYECFLIANILEDDGAALRAHFCETCRIDAVPKKVGPDAKRFSFQGVIGRDFVNKKIRVAVINGAASPVTAVNYPTGETAAAWIDDNGTSRYALLVLKYKDSDKTVKRLELASAAAAGYYSETGSAITLHTADGLATNDKALIVYLA
ncbi:hypothetical protein [Candidatus Formimonas warabiya]|uniref:Phage tail protein n=1 Tax=Formimonas warabiya TaxID=1761012 RepID=A0A3G1KNX7_FORW1|nr:hypothetical protein [Candidatus Formimonas warabiya]ATW24168.1 hypothetical protein DCMF_04660 [Candidatus Formimonas warabiya]